MDYEGSTEQAVITRGIYDSLRLDCYENDFSPLILRAVEHGRLLSGTINGCLDGMFRHMDISFFDLPVGCRVKP